MTVRGPDWRSSFHETYEQWRERRDAQKEIAAFLASDLYERVQGEDTDNSGLWRSPLDWAVRFVIEADTWRCIILSPDGSEYARLERPNSSILDEVLP